MLITIAIVMTLIFAIAFLITISCAFCALIFKNDAGEVVVMGVLNVVSIFCIAGTWVLYYHIP